MVFSNGGPVISGESATIHAHLNPPLPPASVVNYDKKKIYDEGIRDEKVADDVCTNGDDENVKSKSYMDDSNGVAGDSDIQDTVEQATQEKKDSSDARGIKTDGNVAHTTTFPMNPHLPKPAAPPGICDAMNAEMAKNTESFPSFKRSNSTPLTATEAGNMPAIGNFFLEKSKSVSAAISNRFPFLTVSDDNKNDGVSANQKVFNVTEFRLSGLKVIVQLKNEKEEFEGRISFFSRSNCRDSRAVRSLLRERNLCYVEINIDVFPAREKELIDRTGSSVVPQIYFNEKLIGGLEALYSLRNSGKLEEKLKEVLRRKCPEEAPAPAVYGCDEPGVPKADDMVAVVRVLRQRMVVQDRMMKMKMVKSCFSAEEMMEVLMRQFDCERTKVVEIGKQLSRKHFIHNVFGENEFEEGNHFYRFLEHEPFIHRCYNFRGVTNDLEPKLVTAINLRLYKLMSAILESYVTEDHLHIDYLGISSSEEFRRYAKLMQDLQRVDIWKLSVDERLSFFLNLYNAMVIDAIITLGHPGPAVMNRRSFNSNFYYVIGGLPYSLTMIKNGVLRNNRRAPYAWAKPFSANDKRLELAFPKVNPLIHFGLCNGTRSSPPIRFYTPQGVESELRNAAREFLQKGGFEVDLVNRTVCLTRILKWFNVDFGQEKEMLNWIINYLDSTKAGLLTHLSGDGGPINVIYHDYDWSVNC